MTTETKETIVNAFCSIAACLILAAVVMGTVWMADNVWAADLNSTDAQRQALLDSGNLTSVEKGLISGNIAAYQIDEANATTTYIRYRTGAGIVFIKKISVSGTVTTIEKSYTNWTARATATFVAINN